MATAPARRQAIVQAYRHLYRQGLKAINYSTPSRHVLVRTLRSSFRSSPAQDFDPVRITNTLTFLDSAANISGIEHKIVKNLLMLKYWDQPGVKGNFRTARGLGFDQRNPNLRRDAREHFDRTLMLFNESLGTCLR
ncbi:uncharacterized protein BDV17DRAFT_290025 [Aspergillus undulatus]|uniref:uncharacterized protein n=1 Tax=Aspergillus undulatus TaxID=1810928 RepID=UPI003CCCC479